ncbi:hypothetical protein P7D98_19575 [Enterococcus avium]|uniref:Uncharacterized protein n=1 Tax=Enterococcus avium TaxID=33945 RepID=A0ABD5F608_ENTAV|nr:hypothetical protein [Enterococcus avium]MDT2434268.1 hypothetical protein [Enterococcus avium]MDT2467901.1 hypothetical protein [Enterococcus avium]MDT2485266.1 hypothetical protein [Enterococcus avium]MDT2507274.1 hypothetical protein [Enterococcus avium]MDT2512106.1 hypothetical protein [Enterococcus avium]
MEKFVCNNCGSNKLNQVEGYWVCEYCHSKFIINTQHIVKTQTKISLNEDIERLFELIIKDPSNTIRYANLILDIDPTNAEASKYLH